MFLTQVCGLKKPSKSLDPKDIEHTKIRSNIKKSSLPTINPTILYEIGGLDR
jgi:hypothetical protein